MSQNSPCLPYTHGGWGVLWQIFRGSILPVGEHCEPTGKIEPWKNLPQNPHPPCVYSSQEKVPSQPKKKRKANTLSRLQNKTSGNTLVVHEAMSPKNVELLVHLLLWYKGIYMYSWSNIQNTLIGDLHDGIIWLQLPESFTFSFLMLIGAIPI